MTTIPSPSGGEAAIFTWLADKVLGGAKRAFDWGWDQAQWAKAQSRYDEQVIRDYGEIRIFGQTDPKSLKDVYTDVYALDRPTAFRRFDPEALATHLWTEDRGLAFRHGERQAGQDLLQDADKFVILGKPGAGKTTFLKYLAVREAQRGAWGGCLGKIPIFVPLRQLAETGQTPDDLMAFIVDQFAICHFPEAAPFVDKLLREGKVLVLFDGLDEVPRLPDPQEDKRGTMALTLERFARQYDRCHIAITSRIAATEYTFGPAFTYLEMADFAPEQVDAFVRAWFWDKKNPDQSARIATQMLKELEQPEHKGIRDLTRNPLLLTLLCLSYAETLSFPARRVEIYQEATQALLKKWDSSRQIRRTSLYKTLSLGRKEQMFARIAWDGFVAGSVLFSQDDLARQLVTYLQHVPEMPDAIDIDGETVLREIVAQHGIFTEQAYHLFSFAHLTFQEYYAALYALDNAAAGTLEILAEHLDDAKWSEVLPLAASLLPNSSQFLALLLTSIDSSIRTRPLLAAWMKWIDEKASILPLAIGRSSKRLYIASIGSAALLVASTYEDGLEFGSESDLADKRTHNRKLLLPLPRVQDIEFSSNPYLTRDFVSATAFDLARSLSTQLILAQKLTRAKKLAFSMTVDWYFSLDGKIDNHSLRSNALLNTLMEIQLLSEKVESSELQGQLSKFDGIDVMAKSVVDMEMAEQVYTMFESQSLLKAYEVFRDEAKKLKNEQDRWWSKFGQADIEFLESYFRRTSLFADCLLLANSTDRQRFEDRIFAPPA